VMSQDRQSRLPSLFTGTTASPGMKGMIDYK